jgi:hypothetical protein
MSEYVVRNGSTSVKERARLNMQHSCGGTYEPVSGWSSRYRCNLCGVFGYRRAAVQADAALGIQKWEDIIAYCYKTKGCGQGAVAKDKGYWRCGAHRRNA